MAADTDVDEVTDFETREEERKKKSKKSDGGTSSAADLLSLGGNDEVGESRDFFWDQALKLFASGMLALTLLEVLSSISGETVQCLTPDNYTRDQGAFINAYCTQFTQRTDFFLFLLIAQAILVYGPHFLWSSVYFGKFCYFTALAISLDRHRNSKTGEFDLKNFVTVRALVETFGSTYMIYITYLTKQCLQVAIAGVFIGVCATLFNEYDPTFDCPANDSLYLINDSWPLDGQIVCVLSSLNLLIAVWWANFVLLTGTVVVSLCGLVWCGLNHQTKLNWKEVARFALQSGIQPSYYRPKPWKGRWFSRYALKFRIRSNMDFLFLRLYRDDAGRAQVLREVLIAQLIREQEQRLQERLSFLRRVGDEGMCTDLLDKVEKKRIRREEPERCNCKADIYRAQENKDLGNTLENVLCNFLTNAEMKLDYVNAVDVSFGSSGFKMLIATMDDCDQVVSVNFDPHYLNEEKPFETSSFLSEIESFKTWSTIFSKKREEIDMLRDEIAKRFFDIEQLQQHSVQSLLKSKATPTYDHESINVILVGPIPKKESQHVITVHWLLMMLIEHRLLNKNCYLVTVRPCRVEDEAVEFVEFEPAWLSASRTRADTGEQGSNATAVEGGRMASSGSIPVQSSTNSGNANPRTHEVAYLRYGPIHLNEREGVNQCGQADGEQPSQGSGEQPAEEVSEGREVQFEDRDIQGSGEQPAEEVSEGREVQFEDRDIQGSGEQPAEEVSEGRGRKQAKQGEFVNHYVKPRKAEEAGMEEVSISACGCCCGIQQEPKSPVERGNVLVECGSTLCEIEIKVYEIQASTYARKGQQRRVSTSSQATDDVDASDPQSNRVQSCPQLHNPLMHDHPQLRAPINPPVRAVQSVSEIRHPLHAETSPQLHARNSSSVCVQSLPPLEEAPISNQLTANPGSATLPETLV